VIGFLQKGPLSEESIAVATKSLPSRTENFLIEMRGFKIRKQRSIHAVVFGIVGRLFQIVVLFEVLEIKLDNTVLECGEGGQSPMA